jgi:hypothetical protein
MCCVLDEEVSLLREVRVSLCRSLHVAAAIIFLLHSAMVSVAVVQRVMVVAANTAVLLVEVVMVVEVATWLRV